MIDWNKSAELNNMSVEDLKVWFDKYPGSGKRIIAICDNPDCEKERELYFRAYRSLCRKCANGDPDRCVAFSKTMDKYWSDPDWCNEASKRTSKYFEDPKNHEKTSLGLKNSELHQKNLRDENINEKRKRSVTEYWSYPENHEKVSKRNTERYNDPEERKKTGESVRNSEKYKAAMERIHNDPEQGKRISAGHQHIPYDEWEAFIVKKSYCLDFNEEIRELNRDKYGRMCFLSGLPEIENIGKDGKQRKLSVHHYDMDREQGCNDKIWKLVPLCMEWHSKVHNELWEARIIWLLENVWN